MNDQLIGQLRKNYQFSESTDLTSFTTFKLGATGSLLTIKSVDELKSAQVLLNKNQVSVRVLGLGANQIIPQSFDGIYLKLEFEIEKDILKEKKESYRLPASLNLVQLTQHAIVYNLKGWDSFTGIPATLGGAIFMNAGTTLGEIGSLATEVRVVSKEGETVSYSVDEKSFSYRCCNFLKEGDIIFEVTLKNRGVEVGLGEKIKNYLRWRSDVQPLNSKTCGCVFKNHNDQIRAGKSIDILGLSGFTLGDIRISHKHANFMENIGNASYNSFKEMVELVSDELYLYYGVLFQPEVKIE
ncbi:MAG: FAD-binding protein [Bacteriovoracaceae bacterium]|jgi:UDP-N-acetylmuramate dehydrogenase|nr:FAD-binding protein [Bacteriovoracaceae bacterium]